LDPAQKRLVLAGLAEIPEPASLALALPLLDQPGVTNEASQAIIQIAPALPDGQIEVGERALNKVLAGDSIDAATRQAADAALKQIGERTDFITTWQVAGPFRVAGKDYAALFDITFPPEHPEAGTANWRPLAARTNPKRPWLLDLAKALGGEQCVAYARTWIYSPAEQTARLEIGADDGVKAWLNDELIHANNVARALQPGSDVVSITLHPGWNALRLKVTQFNQGWEFCARLRKPDGSHLDGWRVQAAPPGK
jgi:hypothetical protein